MLGRIKFGKLEWVKGSDIDANARRIPGRPEGGFEAPDATAKIGG